MSDPADPRDPTLFGGGPVLGPDGRLEGSATGQGSATPPPPAAEPPLELQDRPPRPEPETSSPFPQAPFAAPTAHKRRGGFWLLALLVAAVVLAVIALGRGFRFGADDAPVAVIDTDPSGAEIRIDGQPMGSTPLLFQNRYPARAIPLELRAPGFKRWSGTFQGDQEVKLDIKLEPQRH